jgi:DNA-directed RNA polymerase specialized sigma24 family protein
LEREDSAKARVVKLRYFVGMKNEEIANLLDVNEKTVRRTWELAKVRLVELIKNDF